jgi:very-short-patch-repair endonuclease
MNNLVILKRQKLEEVPVTTSKIIADMGGVQHRAIIILIQKYKKLYIEFMDIEPIITKKQKRTTGGRSEHFYNLNFDQVSIILSRSRMPNMNKLAFEFGISKVGMTQEQKAMSVLMESFKHLAQITQYCVKGTRYKIDLYFPDIKLAIECDEHNHKNYKDGYDSKRQLKIESILNCKFIRFNPDEANFNIGSVINQIITIAHIFG